MELQLRQLKYFINHKAFWLLANISCLGTLHLYFIWKISGKLPSLIDFLCWTIILFLLWKERNKIRLHGNIVSSLIGLFLVSWMILRHTLIQININSSKLDVLSGFFPIITLMSILLIIAGFKRLIDYKSEILVSLTATILSLPLTSVLSKSNVITNMDAKLTAFILHYIGLKVFRQGSIVSLLNGSIEIFTGCSSISPILAMFPILLAFILIYHTSKIKKMFVCISAVLSIYLVNAIRLSLLVISVNKADTANFEYWHSGEGNGIISNLIVVVIAGLAYKIK